MNLLLTLQDIDYQSLISFVSENAGHIFGLFSRGNLNNVAIKAINVGESFLIKKLHSIFRERGMNIWIKGIQADLMNSNTIRLTVSIAEIDLASIAKVSLPTIQKSLTAKPRLSILVDLMKTHPEAFTSCISSFMEHLPAEKRNKLMVFAINTFNKKIKGAIESFAEAKNLRFTITSLTAE